MTHALIRRARAEGAPLIEGDTATFVWRGRTAPRLIGDFNDWDPGRAIALTRAGPSTWIHRQRFPRDAYLEYAYLRAGRRVPDPLNRRSIWNGLGAYNHFFYMPGAAPTPLTGRVRGTPRGVVTRHVVESLFLGTRAKRGMHLYQPATSTPCPLVVVFDGWDYLRRARLPVMVDNLIAGGRIRPIALAMVSSRPRTRVVEYACSDATLGFLLEAVLPLARARLNLIDVQADPGAHGVLGASMGGVMALYTGLRLPHIFGRVLSQSGAFSLWGHDLAVYDLVRAGRVPPLRIWMDVGRYEWLLGTNRRMARLLRRKGCAFRSREYHAGHNYTAWRNDLWRGLEWLFAADAAP